MPRLRNLLILLVLFTSGCISGSSKRINNEIITIAQIQGCAHKSPFTGKSVEGVRGVVTAKAYNGFYMQSFNPDGLDCSSEGIFVFTDEFAEVIPGDEVRINGLVQEFLPGAVEDKNLTITEIINPEVNIISTGNSLPPEVEIGYRGRRLPDQIIDNDSLADFDPDEDGADFYESLESMLVSVEGGVVVGPRNAFNEIVIIPQEFRKLNQMSSAGALIQTENDANPERLILNLNQENKQSISIGAVLQEQVIGVMDYSYGNYKVKAFGIVQLSETFPMTTGLKTQENTLSLVTYNVENLSIQDEERKFRAIASDIIDDLKMPDIILLHEVMDDSGIEDDGNVSAAKTINRLIDAIVREGGPVYSLLTVDPEDNTNGGIPGGNIRSVLLYRSDSGLFPVEDSRYMALNQNPTVIGSNKWPFSATRKPLVALMDWQGHRFLVVAVHLTSRGLDSPLFGSVQPIERLEEQKRIAQAALLMQFLTDFHQKHPEMPIILAGDVNDDIWSKTLSELTSQTLYDAGKTIADNERYSYILDGNAIQLDHILVSDPASIVQYTIPHLNSMFDHNLQISDHDPVLIELDFGTSN